LDGRPLQAEKQAESTGRQHQKQEDPHQPKLHQGVVQLMPFHDGVDLGVGIVIPLLPNHNRLSSDGTSLEDIQNRSADLRRQAGILSG
jgi:hypothetical protein